MSRSKSFTFVTAICLIITATFALAACTRNIAETNDGWKTEFDIELPELSEGLMTEFGLVSDDGWYATLIDDFEGDSVDEDKWDMFPAGKRDEQYWCDQQVTVESGNASVCAHYCEDHICDKCPVMGGYFTSGIQTMDKFEQAFGYYEVRVKVPDATGITSMFRLTSASVSQMGDRGMDGTKIDVFESVFYNSDRNNVGHSLKYDIGVRNRKAIERISDTENDLYSGFNTYALLWTPTHYVFYVNDVATWATDFGGVSKVPAYLMIGNDISSDLLGAYNSVLGEFSTTEKTSLEIDYVRVYQNRNYEEFIKNPESFISKPFKLLGNSI